MTDPLELLFRLILQNARNVPVYALMIIGGFYERVNKSEKALQVYRSAITKFGNREVPMKYTIWSEIGSINHDLGRYQEAEETYQRIVEGLGRILGQSHPKTIINKYFLGRTFQDQGKYAEAEEIFQKVIKEEQMIYGLEHAHTLISLYHSALVFYETGRYLEAEEIYRRVLKGKEKVFGSEHTYTLQTVHELGNAFEYQDKHVQAKETYQRATKGREQTLGPSHEDTLESMKCLEDVLGCLEDYEREGEQIRALFD